MDAGSGASGRRAYDRDIDPLVAMAIETAVADTRHLLRSEFTNSMVDLSNKITALSSQVSEGNLRAVRDNAEVKSRLREAAEQVHVIPGLEARIAKGESQDRTDDAVATALNRQVTALRRTALALAGLIVAAAGVLAAVLHH